MKTTSVISRRAFLTSGAAIAIVGDHAVAAPSGEERFYGIWSGTLIAGSRTLPVRFDISLGPTARLISIAEEDSKSAERVYVRGDRIEIEFKSIRGRFEGTLVADDRIDGTWHQMLYHLPLQLTRGAAADVSRAAVPLTQARLSAARRRAHIPALGAAWQRGSVQPQVLVDGLRSVAATAPVTVDDQWHIGSVTKSMTATLIATAVSAGEMRWTDTVGERLGGVITSLAPDARSLTLLELLSHRAGLAANLPDNDLAAFVTEASDVRGQRLTFVSRALSLPMIGKPREAFLYSNLGYVVAAAMLETTLQKSWEALMRERIFRPLGLTTAGFGSPGRPGQLDQPVGHRAGALAMILGDRRRPAPPRPGTLTDNVVAMGPAGRVHLSLADLCRYLQAHRDRDVLFDASLWDVLHAPPFGGSYALGWERQADGRLWHNGSNTLWYAEVSIDKDVVSCAVANDGVLATTAPVVGEVLLDASHSIPR